MELKKLRESIPDTDDLRAKIRYIALAFAEDALQSPPAPIYRVTWEAQKRRWILTNMSTKEKRPLTPPDLERYIMALSIVRNGG